MTWGIHMADLKEISALLKKRGKVRGNPVAISLFRDNIPEDYNPIQDTPCAIVRYAMDEGRKVYFDKDHHDCYVGVHHAGIIPGKKEIVSGLYLSETSDFFTYEAAARLKSGTPVLPTGMVRAIGAAPLDEVDDAANVDWIIVVCNPYNTGFIAGARLAREGIPPYGSYATSLCGEIFARPWHINNIMVVGGDFGGRMHNKIKQDEHFVVIPIEFIKYLPHTLNLPKMNITESRKMTKPPHSKFWEKLKAKEGKEAKEEVQRKTNNETDAVKKKESAAENENETADDEPVVDISAINFTYPWTDEAKDLLLKVPPEIIDMVVGNGEEYARENGYKEVSRKSLEEQMKSLGMDLDELLDSVS